MPDIRALCASIIVAALLVSGAIIYGASMVRNELHGMVIPAVGDLDGDGRANDVVLGAYGQAGYIIGNESKVADRRAYIFAYKDTSFSNVGDVMDIVGSS